MSDLNGVEEDCGDVGVEDPAEERIMLVFEGEEWILNHLEELDSLSGEECENENKTPLEKDFDLVSQKSSHASNSVCVSPLKRASPLSPILFDNVLPTSTLVVPIDNDTGPPVTPTDIPKIEEKQPAGIVSTKRRSKRKRILNRKYTDWKLPDEKEASIPPLTKKSPKVLHSREEKEKESTSQKASDSSQNVSLPVANYRILDDYTIEEATPPDPDKYRKHVEQSKEEQCRDVMYEMDEVDVAWLEAVNKLRTEGSDGLNLGCVEDKDMELIMDRLEKESYFELQNSGIGQPGESDLDVVCCICLDEESDSNNQTLYCDFCNIPVHQDCFGVPFIPEGTWLCRRCSFRPNEDIDCIFCPNKDGAFMQTIDGRWSHVLCALWIPELRFVDPSLVDLVKNIEDIPPARWKLTCFLCKKKGACIQCDHRGCFTAFHVTCAQAAGFSLKMIEMKDSTVRLKASCDKHTSHEEMVALKQKIDGIKKILNEKRPDPPETPFLSFSHNRVAAISQIVSFPGKQLFMRRLLAYWKLKRKSRGGVPLLKNLESLWSEDMIEPPAPPRLERQCDIDPALAGSSYGKMTALKTTSTKQVYLDILDKLGTKDKYSTFAEPVTDDVAPGYFNVISTPMDLSTMREKASNLEYSTIDDLETDFNLMITNCMTYNKKSTPYYKDAVKLKEYGDQIIQGSRLALQKQSLDEDNVCEKKPDTLVLMTDDKTKGLNGLTDYNEVKYYPLHGVLISIIDQLACHDKNGIFEEPVDVNKVTDYLTIIKQPMDFSTMKKKLKTNQYSSIEELEADYFLMINNCLQYNEESTVYFKAAEKLNELGKTIFNEAKHKYNLPDPGMPSISKVLKTKNNKNDKTESDSVVQGDTPGMELMGTVDIVSVMSDVLKQLIEKDVEKVFAELVTDNDAPGYSKIIETPIAFSSMEEKLESSSYTCLEDLEKDFALMIDNCKRYNKVGTFYNNYAKTLKRAGNIIFKDARKQQASCNISKADEQNDN